MTDKKQSLLASMKHTFSMQLWAWKFIMPWKFRFFPFVVMAFFEPSWQSLTMGLTLKVATASLVAGDFTPMPRALMFMIISVVAGAALFSLCYMQIYIVYAKGEGNMLRRFFAHVQGLPVPQMEKQLSGDFSTRLSTDVISATQMFGWPGVGEWNFYATLVQVTVLAITILRESLAIGAAAVLLSLVALALNLVVTPHVKKAEERRRGALSRLTQVMIDVLSGNAVARVFGLVARQEREYSREAGVVYRQSQGAARWSVAGHTMGSGLVWLAAFITVAIGSMMATQGKVPIASVVFITTLQINMSFSMLGVGRNYTRLLGPAASCQRVKEILDMPQEQERPATAAPDADADYAIELDDLTFSYQQEDEAVLRGVNLSVKRGQRVAIVGGSGGGKSTLIKLLMEFAPRSGGGIRLMGHDIREYSQSGVRAMSAYVPQDCYLFDGSMRDNIRWGNPDATDERVEAVAKEAGLWDFIQSMPEGFDTRVGERGAQLSGGQRQRVAIARALLKDAPILLLDEATSSLDTESEQEVQQALDRLMRGRTSLIVAHRLSTIRHADQIIVMEEGRILERGTHQELMDKESRYAQLYRMQFV